MVSKAFLKKWVKALRSGKYKQIQGSLKGLDNDGENGYCCLGVACVVRAKETKKAQAWYAHSNGSGYAAEWLLPLKDQKALVKKNDAENSKWDFKRIADYIEKKYINVAA